LARTRKLEVVLAGDAKGAQQAFAQTEKSAGGMGKAVLAAGAVVAAAAAGAAVGLFKIGSAFDEQYDKIRVGTGATGDALKGLQGDFKAVVSTVPTDFASAGTAVADLNTRLGLTGKPLQDISAQFLELSRITETDVSSNIANLTRVFGDWGIEAQDQAGTLDKVFRAAQATGAGIDSLSTKVVQFGAPLRQLGFSFDESIAILGKFEKEGVNTELVLGSMRQALGRMARAGEDPIKTFRRVTEQIKSTGSAGEANALALELFGARAGPDMAAAIREGRFELGDLLDTISNGSETIMQAGADTQDFAEKWQMFKNRVLVALEPVAMRVFDALSGLFDLVVKGDFTRAFGQAFNVAEDSPVVATLFRIRQAVIDAVPVIRDFVHGALGALRAWWDRNGPAIIATATGLAAGIKGAFGAIVGAAQFVVRNWETIRPVVAGVIAFLIPGFAIVGAKALASAAQQAAAWAMTQTATLRAAVVHSTHVAAMVGKFAVLGVQALLHAGKVAAAWLIAMGPIGLVIAAVAGLVTLVIIHWDTIKRVTLDLWNKLKEWTASAWASIKNILFVAVTGLAGLVIIHWDTIKRVISQAWESIKSWTASAWSWITSTISGGLSHLGAIWRGAWDGIRSFLSGVWEGMKGTVSRALDGVIRYFIDLPGRILGALGDLGRLLWDKGKQMISGLVGGIKDAAAGIGGAVGGAVNSAISAINPFGDGPGAPTAPGPGPGRGGTALRRVQSIIGAYPGTRITSTYRSPAQNRAVGGSPTSYHLDKWNPAVDIGGPTWQLDRFYAALGTGWREKLWRVKGHFDHVHVAHRGEYVGPGSPGWRAGLAADERLRVVQVGETIVPTGGAPGSVAGTEGEAHVHFHIGSFVGSDERALAELWQRAKRKGYVGV
jgi:TP901 family phage tail tape measure protein